MNKIRLLTEFIKKRWLLKWKDRQAVEKYQKKKLKAQLRYMAEHSPYFAKHGFRPLPKMNKQFMMENFDELNTVSVRRDEAIAIALEAERSRDFSPKCNGISVGLSSGTSGHRGIFLSSDDEQALWAGNICAKLLPPGRIFGNKIAFFLRSDNNLYQSVKSKVLDYQYYNIADPVDQSVQRLNGYQPTMLIAPPSMLLLLAAEVEAGQLNIWPEKVISVAEILEESDKAYLQKVFQQEVIHQVYQATEGFLACTCRYGNLHINEDVVMIRKHYIDENRYYPIITDLVRKSQPMINYELNDILVEEKEPCPCGSPFQRIKAIEGRADDIFLFANQAGSPVRVFPDFIRRCMLFVEGIRDYQVILTAEGKLEIACNTLTDKQKEQVVREFAALAEESRFVLPEISFIPYQRDGKVKMKRIVSRK